MLVLTNLNIKLHLSFKSIDRNSDFVSPRKLVGKMRLRYGPFLVMCLALGLAQHHLPPHSNCGCHYSRRQHHQQADLGAQCFLSSAKATLFRLFEVGLPAASSWVLPAPLSHPCDPS